MSSLKSNSSSIKKKTIKKSESSHPIIPITSGEHIKEEEDNNAVKTQASGENTSKSANHIAVDVKSSYNIGKELGSGRFGVVRLVQKKSYERKRFALKSIPRTLMHN
jgi:hypothetical protein